MRRLNLEQVDEQIRRAYPDDRLPGVGLDRSTLGQTGRQRLDKEERERRRQNGRCTECGGPILGRQGNAATCLVHRGYGRKPDRAGLVALLAEHEAVVVSLRAALAAMDACDGGSV